VLKRALPDVGLNNLTCIDVLSHQCQRDVRHPIAACVKDLRYPIAGPVTVILLSEQVEHRRHIGWDHFSELRPHRPSVSGYNVVKVEETKALAFVIPKQIESA